MARRKKKKGHGHVDESWLIPYADLLTLLLALFIAISASSTVDAEKFRAMSEQFQGIFSAAGNGIMEVSPGGVPDGGKKNNAEIKKDAQAEQEQIKKNTANTIKASIDDYIKEKKLEGKVSTMLTKEGLMLTIREDILFDSGSAKIKIDQRKTAKEISGLLEIDPPVAVTISGHTDNRPIKTAAYPSNWYLSVDRAVNFMSVLLENKKLDQQNFSAKGFGEQKPIATNNTEKGRQKNRRVEVLIEPQDAISEN